MRQIIRANRRLSVAAGNIEDIFRLAQAGNASPQASHQLLAFRNRGAQMRRARRQVAVMQVIGLDSAFDKGRIRASRVAASSLTPRSSTDWLTRECRHR